MLDDPEEAASSFLLSLIAMMAEFDNMSIKDELRAKEYFDFRFQKMQRESNTETEKLYWATFKHGMDQDDLLKTDRHEDRLEAMGIGLARIYAKSGIIEVHNSISYDPYDSGIASCLLKTFANWSKKKSLKNSAFEAFMENPFGFSILLEAVGNGTIKAPTESKNRKPPKKKTARKASAKPKKTNQKADAKSAIKSKAPKKKAVPKSTAKDKPTAKKSKPKKSAKSASKSRSAKKK